jgi:hypothetical protein
VVVVCDQEPEEFNKFLTKTYERLKKGDVANFFQLLSSRNISLISKEEAPDRFASFLLVSPLWLTWFSFLSIFH